MTVVAYGIPNFIHPGLWMPYCWVVLSDWALHDTAHMFTPSRDRYPLPIWLGEVLNGVHVWHIDASITFIALIFISFNFTKIQLRVPGIRLITHGWHGNPRFFGVFHTFQALQIQKKKTLGTSPNGFSAEPLGWLRSGASRKHPAMLDVSSWDTSASSRCRPEGPGEQRLNGIVLLVILCYLLYTISCYHVLFVDGIGMYCLCIATRNPKKMGWLRAWGLRVSTLEIHSQPEPIF